MRKVEIYKYTRFFIFAVFALLSIFAVTAQQAHAMDPVAREVDPRCDPDIDEIQQNHSFLKKIEQQARTAQETPQNDTGQALTCFDQQMIQSAKAGNIFSDTMPASFPASPFNAIISVGLNLLGVDTGTNPGSRGSTLLDDFDSVITSVLGELLGEFTGALTGFVSDLLGTAIGGILGGLVGSFLGSLLGDWFGTTLGGQTFDCTAQLDIWSDPFGNLPGGSHPVVGTGPKIGINSGNYHLAWPSESDILSGIAGLPAEYVTKFTEPDNAITLGNVLTDLTVRLVPGGIAAYKVPPPALNLNSSLAAVIGAM